MKFKRLNVLLFAFTFTFFVVGCNNSIDDNNTTKEQAGTITISSSATSATVGDVVLLSVSFSDWETNPASVDIYGKELSDAVKTGVAVSDGKITLDTSYFEAGTYNLYVVSGCVKSNSIEVTLTENALKAPTELTVVASTKKANTINITWTAPSDTSAITYYWIYYSTINDTTQLSNPNKTAYAPVCVTNETGKYDITLSESGSYYFWVKAANGNSYSKNKTSDFSTVATYTYSN